MMSVRSKEHFEYFNVSSVKNNFKNSIISLSRFMIKKKPLYKYSNFREIN